MLVFFFFQAEDGIRDIGVTGVQTCAIPISTADSACASSQRCPSFCARSTASRSGARTPSLIKRPKRSEERRVGKECRSRRSAYHSKKKRKDLVEHRLVILIRDTGACNIVLE